MRNGEAKHGLQVQKVCSKNSLAVGH